MDSKDDQYHLRCLELASCGLGNVAPNPLVGALIVVDGKIIGEGYHARYGGPHAEVNAIDAVQNKELLKKATLYVSLEPCSHYGKTPPCADLIIEHKIPKVVVGHLDPFREVSGKGIEKLRNAGIEVIVGENENKYRFLNRRFLTFQEKSRPYIILKWAETSDGFIDRLRCPGMPEGPNWITDPLTKVLVHKWRTEEQAILVGTHTILNDNPQLTAREWPGHQPTRMVPDINLRLPMHLHVFDQSVPTIVFTSQNQTAVYTNLEYFPSEKFNFPERVMDFCVQRKIQSIFIEGGAKLIQSFINMGLWDEARVFRGQLFFGEGIKAPERQGILSSSGKIGSSELFIYHNQNSGFIIGNQPVNV